MRVFLFKLLSTFFLQVTRLSFFVEFCRRESSTQFDNLQRRLTKLLAKFVEQCCRRIRQQFSTTFSYNIRQHSTKFFVECWRKMSNAVNWWRKILSKNVVELRQYFSTIIFDKVRQQSTKNLSIAGEICKMLSKFTVEKSWRKFLAKILVEKRWRKMLSNYNSTIFFDKFLQ